MSGRGWLGTEHGELAAERILDAAGRLFVARGVTATGMGDVARAAGCSRATLYRYFENRAELRSAYVHRAARRIGAEVAGRVDGPPDPHVRLVEAVLDVLARVRADPSLAVWFTADDSALATSIARSSSAIEAMVAAFLGAGDAGEGAGADVDLDVTARARWLVRVIVSLLAVPGGEEAEERELLRRFVAPVVAQPPGASGATGVTDTSTSHMGTT